VFDVLCLFIGRRGGWEPADITEANSKNIIIFEGVNYISIGEIVWEERDRMRSGSAWMKNRVAA